MVEEPEVDLRLQASLLLALAALMVVLQLIAPYRGWIIVLIALGGALLSGYFWTRSLVGAGGCM